MGREELRLLRGVLSRAAAKLRLQRRNARLVRCLDLGERRSVPARVCVHVRERSELSACERRAMEGALTVPWCLSVR